MLVPTISADWIRDIVPALKEYIMSEGTLEEDRYSFRTEDGALLSTHECPDYGSAGVWLAGEFWSLYSNGEAWYAPDYDSEWMGVA